MSFCIIQIINNTDHHLHTVGDDIHVDWFHGGTKELVCGKFQNIPPHSTVETSTVPGAGVRVSYDENGPMAAYGVRPSEIKFPLFDENNTKIAHIEICSRRGLGSPEANGGCYVSSMQMKRNRNEQTDYTVFQYWLDPA